MLFDRNQTSSGLEGADQNDPHLERQIEKLFRSQIRRRWWVLLVLWLTVGAFCIWTLRSDIALWLDHFTWAAVRISIRYNRFAFIGLGTCVGITLSTLLRQSAYILKLSPALQQELIKEVNEIRRRGPNHPLWRQVCAIEAGATEVAVEESDRNVKI
jgi:hypothetical protein